jgi:cleavage stimulation factor subunit 3
MHTPQKPLNEAMLARPPRGDPVEKEQLRRWIDYIDWERSNPMGYEGSESGNLVKRVHYAYRQCLVVLRHYERLWIDVATYGPNLCMRFPPQ